MEQALKRVKNGKLYLIPASEDTRGHGTTGMAKFYKQQLQELLQSRRSGRCSRVIRRDSASPDPGTVGEYWIPFRRGATSE